MLLNNDITSSQASLNYISKSNALKSNKSY
jgi:hypothetical protein